MSAPAAPLKVVFFGTPELAVPALTALRNDGRFNVTAVVTQTDKPSGRGQKLQPSPVKVAAEAAGIPLFQPHSLRRAERSGGLLDFLAAEAADFYVVVAYGKIIPEELLARPRFGAVNIHFSLLPRWRGAAPLQRAILAGDSETGISIMKMDAGLDTGPVYRMEPVPISDEDTSGTLAIRLSELGAALLVDVLPLIASGALAPVEQPENGATYAEKLTAEDFAIRWTESAAVILAQIRAGTPFPGARTFYEGEPVKIFAAERYPGTIDPKHPPGSVVECDRMRVVIAAGDGQRIAIREIQFPNRKRLPVSEIVKSRSFAIGSRFGG